MADESKAPLTAEAIKQPISNTKDMDTTTEPESTISADNMDKEDEEMSINSSSAEVPESGVANEPEKTEEASEGKAEDNEDGEPASEDDQEMEIPTRFTRSGRRRATPFPVKLMKVLSMKEFRHIIAWTPSGKAFSILKPKLFTVEILPFYFKSAKYSSFTRKLHRWGYMRHYRGPEAGSFYHEDFQRGKLDMAEKMTCYKPESARPPSSGVKKIKAKPKKEVTKPSRLADMPGNIALTAQQASLDAELAIELEVARRLRQRMDAAAFNQQAQILALQQHQKLQSLHAPSFNSPLANSLGASLVGAGSGWGTEIASAPSNLPGLGRAHSLAMQSLTADALGGSFPGGLRGVLGRGQFPDQSAGLNFPMRPNPNADLRPNFNGARSA